MNESFLDLELSAPWLMRRGRRPGPVRALFAAERRGRLFLRWLPPSGARVERYVIDRTREGRIYQAVGETEQAQVWLSGLPLGEPWFYRVRAANAQGVGGHAGVFLYERRGWSRRTGRGSVIQYVAALPGVRVEVCEFVPA